MSLIKTILGTTLVARTLDLAKRSFKQSKAKKPVKLFKICKTKRRFL